MNDDQKPLTEDEQRIQQTQSAGPSSGSPAGGQASFSADYSTAQEIQDGGAPIEIEEVSKTDESQIVSDSSGNVNSEQGEIPAELEEEDDTAAVMNDIVGDNIDEGLDVEEEITEEEPTEEDSEEPVEEEAPSEDGPTQSQPGSVVGPDGQTSVVADSSAPSSEQPAGEDSSGSGDIPAPDLTPETDSTSVGDAIDGAFGDFNDGNDTGATEALGGGVDD